MDVEIAVLDSQTLGDSDVNWHALERLGRLRLFRPIRTEEWPLLSRTPYVLTNKVLIDETVMERLPALRYIGVLATGYNNVDVEAARKRGIAVTNIPGYSTHAVAETVFAAILHFAKQTALHNNAVKKGRWSKSESFCFWDTSLWELRGLTLGVIGYGAIGRQVARVARAFDMSVLIHTRSKPTSLPEGIRLADRETVLRESDVLSLHCPLTDATRHLINEHTLSLMKPEALLVNTGRGPLVDEAALDKVLRQRKIAAYYGDVLSDEPPPGDHPLIGNPYTVITPHIAWATRQARQRLIDRAAENILAFREGKKLNRLDV